MRYGFTTFSYPQLGLGDLVDAAIRFDYQCVELRVGYGHAHGIETDLREVERARCADLLAASGIEVVCLGLRSSFTDPDVRRAEVRSAGKVIELAGSLGTPIARVFGGPIGPETSTSTAAASVEQALRDLAGLAEDQGVAVCIETHDSWTDPAALADLLSRVDHPSIGVVWDVMHPFFVSDTPIREAFDLLRPWIRHVHVHDGIRGPDGIVRCPIGRGEVDHRLAMTLLEASGFRGCVSFEWDGYAPAPWSDWNAPEVHLPRELATLRSFSDRKAAA